MERMLPVSDEDSVVTTFAGGLYTTETHNQMWVRLQDDMSAGKSVRNALSLGEWKWAVNPSMASPNVKTHCYYVSRGIAYVTMLWATADFFELTILWSRNLAVNIHREVQQVLFEDDTDCTNRWMQLVMLGDVTECTNRWIQLVMFKKHGDVRDRACQLLWVWTWLTNQPSICWTSLNSVLYK
jgi:hypothetical protein